MVDRAVVEGVTEEELRFAKKKGDHRSGGRIHPKVRVETGDFPDDPAKGDWKAAGFYPVYQRTPECRI